MQSLVQKCLNFKKLSEEAKISIEKNSNTILQELSDIKEFSDRVKFAKDKWKLLGEGSSRTVFEINQELVIKVAHNEKGLFQNKVEMDPKAQRNCTNPVVVADAEGKWIIIKHTSPITKEKFKDIIGFGFDQFMNALFYKFNNESDEWSPPKDYEEIERSDFFKCLSLLVLECDLQIGDLDKPSSYGELDGKVVLRDYGLNRKVYDKYYAKNNSNPTKSES